MKIMMSMANTPLLPMSANAANGMAIPVVICSVVIRSGKVGKMGKCSVAAAARPKVEARTKGIVNQQRPPMTYPGSVAAGSAAIAF